MNNIKPMQSIIKINYQSSEESEAENESSEESSSSENKNTILNGPR